MQPMKRLYPAIVIAMAVLVACGGGAVAPTTAGSEPGNSIAADVPAPVAISEGSSKTTMSDSLPKAPDFTLFLEPSGEFVLSEAGKPVYLVFWAEW